MTSLPQDRNRKVAGNTGFASDGVTCKLGALCFYSRSVQVDSFVLRNPPERKARNRYAQIKGQTTIRLSIISDLKIKTN